MGELLKGICRLGLVSMRSKPDYNSVQISQLLFGEHYVVLGSVKDWYQIRLVFDQSVGWIHQSHHTTISDEYFEQIGLCDYKVCTDISGTIFFQKKYVNILLGSILPISSNELFKLEEQIAFNGESKPMSQKRDFEYLLSVIDKFRHTPYLPGGKSVFGVDASGMIQQVFKICGYHLPRTLDEMLLAGEKVESSDELRLGDVIIVGEKKSQTGLIFTGAGQYTGLIDGQIRKIENLQVSKSEFCIRRILIH